MSVGTSIQISTKRVRALDSDGLQRQIEQLSRALDT